MRTITYITYLCLFFELLAVGGCTKERLDRRKQEGYVHIALSWPGNFSPAGSKFYFYPENGGPMFSVECPAEGFSGVLPVGSYRMIVVNSDYSNVAMGNEHDYGSAEFYVSPESDSGEGAGFVYQPGMLAFATRLVESEILEVPYRETVRVSALPRLGVKRIRITFEIENFSALVSCSGSFSGVSPSRSCLLENGAPVSASIRFTAAPVAGSSDFVAEISVLDLVPSRQGETTHLLIVDLAGEGGTSYQTPVDLSDTIDRIFSESGGELPDEIQLNVVLSLLDGQLHASVQPWDGDGSGSGVL